MIFRSEAERFEVGIVGETGGTVAGGESAAEDLQAARDQREILRRARKDRDGAGGVVKAVRRRGGEKSIDVGECGQIAEAGAEESAKG